MRKGIPALLLTLSLLPEGVTVIYREHFLLKLE